MKATRRIALASVSVMLLATSIAVMGCKKKEEAQQAPPQTSESATTPTQSSQAQNLVLVQFGPQPITAGKDFNVQPNGQSAVWAKSENVTKSTVIVINNVPMKSTPSKDGKLITCLVPKEVYANPGEYPIALTDTKTGAKSNEMKFVVK